MHTKANCCSFKILALFLLAATIGPASFISVSEASTPGEELDWKSAWEVILENNPGLGSVRRSVQAAYATVKLSAASTRVTASISGTASKQEGDRTSSSGGVSLSYNTSLFGREKALITAETAALRETETTVEISILNLYRQAAISFWGAAAGEASVRAAEEEISKREAFLADARLRYEQGMVPQLDVMRAESALAEARHYLALREASQSGFGAMLKGLAGWKDISPAKGLFDIEEKVNARTDPPDFMAVAEDHPSVEKARWSVEKAASILAASRMISLPNLNITATKTLFANGAASNQYTQDDWWGRATITIPVIDGGKAKWSAERAQAALSAAESALGAARAEVMMNLFSAWEDYVAATRGIEAEQVRFELVSREREIVLLRYREGLANQIEVLDAQTRFAGSLASLIDSKRGLLVAEAVLASAEGKIPIEGAK